MRNLEQKTGSISGVFGALLIIAALISAFGTQEPAYAQIPPFSFSSTIPSEVSGGLNATPPQLYAFAWAEFVAVNWPAQKRPGGAVPGKTAYLRGTPSKGKLGDTGPDGVVVWETFKHKAETYPSNIATVQSASQYTPPPPPTSNPGANQLPPFDSGLGYGYAFPPPAGKNGNPTLVLFDNLDEGNEIKFAYMYYTPFVVSKKPALIAKSPILFEAKLNQVIYDYVRENGLQNNDVRTAAAKRTSSMLTGGPAPKPPSQYQTPKYISLPNGSIEVKATWRFYDETMDKAQKDRYHSATAIYYTSDGSYYNATFLLVGLHIIQKTPAVQTFTFATFEHVDNEIHGFQFMNTNIRKTPTSPGNPGSLRTAIRQHKLPPELNTFNAKAQTQIRDQFGNSVVWANYRLIGVQAKPSNLPTTPPGGNPKGPQFQQYFLANLATETNSALQYFTGGRDPMNLPEPSVTNVYQPNEAGGYTKYSAGGCLGCHGFGAQVQGFDFSFLLADAPFAQPDGIEPYPAPPPSLKPQNASNITNSDGKVVINPVKPQPLK